MKRTIWLILLVLLISTAIFAQPRSTISIGTNPSGALFVVDGVQYITQQVFVWPQGSKHLVQFPFSTDQNGASLDYQSALFDNIHYFFGGWTANTGLLTTAGNSILTITADPTLTSLIAGVTVNYRVLITFPDSSGSGQNPACGSSAATASHEGIFYLDGSCYADSANIFVVAGPHTLNAFPYPGWVFYGFLINALPPAALISYDIQSPATITPLFSIAKRVNFITNPPGLTVLVDGSPIATPPSTSLSSDGSSCPPDFTRLPGGAPSGFKPLCLGQFDFLPGSKHQIGALPTQMDAAGNYWQFSGFNNGLGQNATYTVGTNVSTADTVIANFAPGVHTAIQTQPAGLKIQVDGRDNWIGYTFVWGAGETHHVNAESPQTDSHGRVWTFASWSDGGGQAHDITIPAGVTGYVVNAIYTALPQLTITSNPGSLILNVDGSTCVTPCVVNRPNGTTAQITAPSSIPAGTGARFDFTSWSDGSTAGTRTISFNQSTLALSVNYQTSYQLNAVSNPAKGGTFTLVPSSPDGYYPSGSSVSITTAADQGFKFAHWEGDLSGSFATGTFSMTSPHNVIADFATVPFIPPAGIQSVTGPTPDGAVAPGSIISIYGSNLAPGLKIGHTNPLDQALNNVTVTIGDFLLPLVFVSESQIGAQVPWELAPGTYTLVVHQTGLPDVPGALTVTRNAPGAFTQANDQNLALVLALHPDGTLVNFQNPAQLGEQITIYSTGLGPYLHPAVDGFPTVSVDNYTMADSVSINTDTAQLTPDWAGAATGIVGVQILKLTVTNDLPPSANVSLKINVNGKNSAEVVLPVQ